MEWLGKYEGKRDGEFGGGGGGKEEGEQLKEIVGLVGEPFEVLARTVGDGVRKMMKKREGER